MNLRIATIVGATVGISAAPVTSGVPISAYARGTSSTHYMEFAIPPATAWSSDRLQLAKSTPAVAAANSAKIDNRQAAWGALRSQVLGWSGLAEDWDADGGHAPSNSVLTAAAEFMTLAEGLGMAMPAPFVEGDGEVGFRWKYDGLFASAAFLEDGHVVAIVHRSGQTLFKLDERATQNALQKVLKNLVLLV